MEKKYNTKTKEQEEHQEFVNLDESTQGGGFGVLVFFFFHHLLRLKSFYHLLISIRNSTQSLELALRGSLVASLLSGCINIVGS